MESGSFRKSSNKSYISDTHSQNTPDNENILIMDDINPSNNKNLGYNMTNPKDKNDSDLNIDQIEINLKKKKRTNTM